MGWDDLRFVLAVFRDRTLSAAGLRLGVTHTTVGRRLKTIEEALGVRLFDRTPDGYVATPAGKDIADVAKRVETEVLALEGRVLGRDAKLSGGLRVTTMDLLFERYLPAFRSFMERYPSIELTINSSDDEASLTRREADVALRLSNTPPPYLVGRKVGRVEFAVYGSHDLIERVGDDAGYGAYPWIHWDERLMMRWLDEWLARNAPGAPIALRLGGNLQTRIQAIRAGIGMHFLACFQGDAAPGLRRLGPVHDAFGRDVWLLTLPDLRHASRVRAFMDHMASSLDSAEGA